ncbi:MAG: endo alpha-1,4 polygalactosaminidase [Marmoricola sp.]
MGRIISGILLLLALTVAPATADVAPLPTGTDVDYQLGGARPVPAHVGIVTRDRHARPLPGKYDICYVNGFQTQTDERAFWLKHPHLVLRRDGRPVIDPGWGEQLLDTRTAEKRTRLAVIVGRWITGCAASGFAAVELDNLDSFSRSKHLLTPRDNKAMARLLVARAHRAGLAVGQKNWAEWNGRVAGFDFAVAEECGRYRECGEYVAHYGSRVVAIEYRRADFAWTCAHYGDRLPVVLRDRDLSSTGVRRWC